MINWFWLFSVIVAGVLGFSISLYFNRRDSEQKLKQELETLNSEYQNYQDQVRSHFNRTGELLAQYQQQHQQLQSHIFSAAQSFINPQKEDFSTISTNESISKLTMLVRICLEIKRLTLKVLLQVLWKVSMLLI